MKGNADAQLKVLGADGVSKFVTEAMLRGSTAAQGPSGAHDFASDGALTVTLANGTEVEVVLDGVSVPRSVAVKPASGDTVRIRERFEEDGDWFQSDAALLAMTTDQVHSLDAPVYSIGVTRTAGSGTTSKVVIK